MITIMRHIVNSEEMKSLDSRTIRRIGVPSAVLMERAAFACAEAVLHLSGRTDEDLRKSAQREHPLRVLCVCGSGNNGGDGLACARILSLKGADAAVWFVGNPDHMTEETARQMEICRRLHIPEPESPDPGAYDVIVDAIFGIGLCRPVTGHYADVIRSINESGTPVLAVDIPSGISADRGHVMGCAVKAACTVTMQLLKPGLLFYPGCTYAGTVTAADIGVVDDTGPDDRDSGLFAFEAGDLARVIPARPADGNKGTFGKVLVIAGSVNMAGAACFSASAALHAGCGMVRILTVRENREILQTLLPEAMLATYDTAEEAADAIDEYFDWADAICCGPGMGAGERTRDIVLHVLGTRGKPIVLDADALNCLHGDPESLRSHDGPLILTPHIGEMARLTGMSIREIKDDPIGCASAFARENGVCLVLKDARTVTAVPEGPVYINLSGNDGMATAGSGDVLTGITGAVLARGTDPYLAGAAASFLHGLAGDAARERNGAEYMTAGDIVRGLRTVETEVRK